MTMYSRVAIEFERRRPTHSEDLATGEIFPRCAVLTQLARQFESSFGLKKIKDLRSNA